MIALLAVYDSDSCTGICDAGATERDRLRLHHGGQNQALAAAGDDRHQRARPGAARPCHDSRSVDDRRGHHAGCAAPPNARAAPRARSPARSRRPAITAAGATGLPDVIAASPPPATNPGQATSTRVRATGRNPQRGPGGRARH